jgi:hypothetical protein
MQVGLTFSLLSLFTFMPGAAERMPGNHFFPTLWESFCMPQAGRSFSLSTVAMPAVPAETSSEEGPMTSPPPRSVRWGEYCGEPGYAPGPGQF